MYAYVGSRTTRERNARGEGISVFRVDPSTGALDPVQVLGDLVNPSLLAIDARGERLYSVHGDRSELSAFAIDRASGRLAFLNRQDTGGRNPVHVALAPDGRRALVSNHLGASLAVLPIAADGSLGALAQCLALDGPIGPHRIEQQQAKPHFNPFSPDGRFVLVPDKGLDRIFVFRYEAGRLTPAEPPFVATRETAGPRHLACHPSRPWVYCVNELDSTVTAYDYRADSGELRPRQIVSALPDSYTGNSRAAGIQIDAGGRFLYASNRGSDSIALLRIDPDNGRLAFVEAVSTGGRTPRFFTLSPDGRLLYALNEDSDSIVSFSVDAGSGRLSPTGQLTSTGSPVCMVFSRT
ncbi:lactonase family protein [Burkholderia gladioli]|uniref:lactonase family protein n=1 Tax=Burkholderia gladioli TaxID=28095 RepID=UPI00264F6C8E|nr:lactonase family protein [Burkholderia gladioli]MDN7495618.1 lactonase family protein [Burkholderia gladioli]